MVLLLYLIQKSHPVLLAAPEGEIGGADLHKAGEAGFLLAAVAGGCIRLPLLAQVVALPSRLGGGEDQGVGEQAVLQGDGGDHVVHLPGLHGAGEVGQGGLPPLVPGGGDVVVQVAQGVDGQLPFLLLLLQLLPLLLQLLALLQGGQNEEPGAQDNGRGAEHQPQQLPVMGCHFEFHGWSPPSEAWPARTQLRLRT